ncbi:MAG TPA: ribosome biogenesis GTPase Der [Clostridia bacterium]|nr:ribosome biogenesis GTPase Der [Clostridia bacterium]
MRKPIVAVVGRPNVGKSTFFNKIAGSRISIVEDTPGVTRDRIYADVNWLNYDFTMIDTGGIEPDSEDIILRQMRSQAEIAIETADVIVFMVDGKTGLTNEDHEIALMLRKAQTPVVTAVNKIDSSDLPPDFYEFYNLGMGELYPISSVNQFRLGDLLDAVVEHFPGELITDYDETVTKIAVLGKPNVGKSSLINALLGKERVIVSDIAGTTRDAIDTPFDYQDEKFVFIDTAGIRRKSKISENIEKYSVIRAFTAVDRSDVCLILVDAVEGVTDQDKKIAGYAHDRGKGIIVLANKWDLVEDKEYSYNDVYKNIRNEFAFMTYAPIMFISALTKQRTHKIIDLVRDVQIQRSVRIPTGALNDVLNDAIYRHQPPSKKGKRLKIYYGTQVDVQPPTFALFVNDPELCHFTYKRYISNKLREHFAFEGTSLRIKVRQR